MPRCHDATPPHFLTFTTTVGRGSHHLTTAQPTPTPRPGFPQSASSHIWLLWRYQYNYEKSMAFVTCRYRNSYPAGIAARNGESRDGCSMTQTTATPASLRVKREQWLNVLAGKDQHSIIKQLSQLAWNAASYQVVNEARRLAPSDPEGGVQLNGLMHRLLDRGFFTDQVVGIRRLNDTFPLEGKKGVLSLTGLLDDLLKHRHLLNRKDIFEAEGLKYYYDDVKQAMEEYREKKAEAGEVAYSVPRDLVWRRYELRHEYLDRLMGVLAGDRKPDDVIQKSALVNLQNKVASACVDVITVATKFIAHAATPESRAVVNADDARLSLDQIRAAHRSLCQVTGFLANYVLGDSCPGFLPIPQFDQFAHIEKPLIDMSKVPRLEPLWCKLDDEYQAWSQWGLDEYETEFGAKT